MFDRAPDTNKKPRNVKVRTQNFIKNNGEPLDKAANDTPTSEEVVLVQNSPVMRQRFRQIASRIRIINVHGLRKNPPHVD